MSTDVHRFEILAKELARLVDLGVKDSMNFRDAARACEDERLPAASNADAEHKTIAADTALDQNAGDGHSLAVADAAGMDMVACLHSHVGCLLRVQCSWAVRSASGDASRSAHQLDQQLRQLRYVAQCSAPVQLQKLRLPQLMDPLLLRDYYVTVHDSGSQIRDVDHVV